MKRVTKIIAALLLMTAVVWAVGFTKNNESPNMNESNGSCNGHEYVDLGLPSGTLWATCNIGANKPENNGNYYAWGETQTKSVYKLDNYKFDFCSFTKYCNKPRFGHNGFTDTLTVLQLSDDAARANWGGDWRMPTKTEWQELLDNTTSSWIYKKDWYGRLFTAKNGASLFLPAAGNRYLDNYAGVRIVCHYWSSSLDTNTPACAWNFLSYSDDGYDLMEDLRYCGYSVRPVRSAR